MGEKHFFRIIQYYDHSVLVDNKEHIMVNSNIFFDTCDEIYSRVEEQLAYIQRILSKRVLSDVVMVVIYDVPIESEMSLKLQEIAKTSYSEYKRIALTIFKEYLFDIGKVRVLGTFPILFSNNINQRNIKN